MILLPRMSDKLKNRKWFANSFKLNAEGVNIEKRVLNTLTLFSVIFFIGVFCWSRSWKRGKIKKQN